MRQTLEQWLDYIGGLHPIKWDLTLDRVAEVARRLGVVQPARRVILVAGTNGKGSCCEALAALATGAGVSFGVTTSPHLGIATKEFKSTARKRPTFKSFRLLSRSN